MKRKYNNTVFQKLHKEFCEIEGCEAIQEQLHWHHIIERTEIGTSNDPHNLAVICSNHHMSIHEGLIEIIGVYPSTGRYGRKLIYKIDGVPNVPGIDEPYYQYKMPQMKLYLEAIGDENEDSVRDGNEKINI